MQQNEAPGIIILVILFISFVFWLGRRAHTFLRERNERIAAGERLYRERKAYRDQVSAIISNHLPLLCEDRRLGVEFDRYGVPNDKIWKAKLDYFVEKVIPYKMNVHDEVEYDLIKEDVRKEIEALVPPPTQDEADAQKHILFSELMTGRDFEVFCSKRLESLGWSVEYTSASGDQGADLIAMNRNVRVAIQCKKLNRPVGNGAVQEIAAARVYYNCSAGTVVSNQTFTKAAIELANRNQISLVSYTDLANLEQKILTSSLGAAAGG